MILRLMAVELLKLRRMMLWFLVFLGPFGVVALQAVNFGLRYDYLVNLHQADLWGGLMDAAQLLMFPAMFIGTAIVASMAAGIEHRMNVWKLTLALPVKRGQVYAAKLLLTALLLFVSCTLLIPFLAVLGWILGFGNAPYGELAAMAYGPYMAILPFVALHTALSVLLPNQAIPLTVGVLGTMLSLFAVYLPDWMPWKWPLLSVLAEHRFIWILAGAFGGLLLFIGGSAAFIRKDVK
ncbi:ABC transporter permease [Gorillibacterium sp. sgz5001074]|uniref:ABC transporter permease n=1 Tax=Gorillibacterium sp. sgz5001074 TaxID=3446695 RepID=UPI003F67BE25